VNGEIGSGLIMIAGGDGTVLLYLQHPITASPRNKPTMLVLCFTIDFLLLVPNPEKTYFYIGKRC
jgi:hypothetical protein